MKRSRLLLPIFAVVASMSVFTFAQTTAPAGRGGTQTPAPAPSGRGGQTTPAAGAAARTINLTAGDDMKFNMTTLTAKPGERIRVRLTVTGAMPKMAMAHNFVLLRAGTTAAQQTTFAEQSVLTPDKLPTDAALKALIVANTALAGAGETVEVTFQVPNAAGAYPFLCSFPGHFVTGMRGVLNVAN